MSNIRLRTALGLLSSARGGRAPEALSAWIDSADDGDWTLAVSADLSRARLESERPASSLASLIGELRGAGIADVELARLSALGEFVLPTRVGRWLEDGPALDRGWSMTVDVPLARAQVAADRSPLLSTLETFDLRCTRIRRSLAHGNPFTELVLAIDHLDQAKALAQALEAPAVLAWEALSDASSVSIWLTEEGCSQVGVTTQSPSTATLIRLCSAVSVDESQLARFEGALDRRPSAVTLRRLADGALVETTYPL